MPDQDELTKSAPPTFEEPQVTSSTSSADSENTPTTVVEAEGGEVGENKLEVSDTNPEVADAHISILSKYISDDQVSYTVSGS